MKDKCATCGIEESENGFYEYRGFVFCEPHFDEGIAKVDRKRGEVMEVTSKIIESQRKGEFVNNRGAYHLGNVAADGLPIIKPVEPQILTDYENGIL